ncbi:hypothetical protein [Actinomadura atramentaria]|uniref:hypothetical protein n=1 Tax=Actinomadura atramentaria TaxID=1990 RepID=UPI000363196D|nr:hypothetical protein [Actinomadura atramentaria]
MNLDQVEKRLVGPKEIGSKVRPTNSVPDFYRNGQVPLCSLSSKQPTGTFDATVREYANSGPKGTEVRYAQFIATFKDTASASRAYNDLKKNAEWCPGKKHIDGKRVSKNDLRLPHDDTWKLTEPITAPWLRFHAVELQKYDRSAGEYNWLHAIYDYATQGNLLISTIYMGRTEPDGTSKPIEDRAERIFTEQLDKLG